MQALTRRWEIEIDQSGVLVGRSYRGVVCMNVAPLFILSLFCAVKFPVPAAVRRPFELRPNSANSTHLLCTGTNRSRRDG